MREILFRGNRVDNGERIEGFYAKSGDKTFILVDNDIAVGYVTMKEIIPETVGQYTGLTDKNGKKIFEGDILKDGEDINEVVFERRNGAAYFGVVIGENETWEFCYTTNASRMEIIGNIHDNPELLERSNGNAE